MYEIRQICKSISQKKVLEQINLTIAPGELQIMLGPNGAGKSTLLKILGLLQKPSQGQLFINGINALKNPEKVKHLLGVVSHKTFIYENLSVYENLEFYGKMYGVNSLRKRILEVISLLGLELYVHERVAYLSRGFQQRLTIARAILHQPCYLLLDEPQTGLDQPATHKLYQILEQLKKQGTGIIVSTHIIDKIFQYSDRLVILARGSKVFEGVSPQEYSEIKELYGSYIKGV
ncbi:MAG: heme exporter protein [Clostridia bacterium]|nr:heme exporter protein [Clostridia bacterium]